MAPMEYTPIVYSRKNGKDMVLWNIFSRCVNGHSKRLKKKYSIKDTLSIKISFIHYIKWTRVMFSVFEKIFLVLFSFSLSLSIGKNLGAEAFPSITVFYGSGITYRYYKIVIMDYNILLKFYIASCI